ncbi:MAG TPA: ATP-binding protein [Blastocatellia bacterium]|nr:ATP-binding protein [Blastocatellia bacterium]
MMWQDRMQENVASTQTHERILQWSRRIVEHSRQLAALNSIASSVSQSLDFQETLESAISQVLHLMECDAGMIFLTDVFTGDLTLKASAGISPATVSQIERINPGDTCIGRVMQTGEPAVGEIPTGDGHPLSRSLRREGYWFFAAIPLRSKGRTLGVLLIVHPHPKQVDADARQFLTAAGDIIGVAIENAALYRDVAELLNETRHQAEKLRESERQFRTLIDSANDAVAIVQDGRFQYLNPFGLALFGYTAEEIRHLCFLDLVHPRDRETVARHHLWRSPQGMTAPLDIMMVRKDGTAIPVNLNACAIDYWRKPAVLIIVRDMTESHRLRQQILHTEKMAALGQLISGIAHELNNPLTTVIGYSELLCQQSHPPEELLEEGLTAIHEAARRASQIVRNLLAFARQHPVERSPVNINELMERTLALRSYELKVNNIEIVTDFDPQLPLIVADGAQLQQVFLNLIINAEQAMQAHGGGHLFVRTRVKALRPEHDCKSLTGEVSPASQPSNGQRPASADLPSHTNTLVEIIVADDGPGIPPDLLHRIFEPFFTTKPVGQGTGLGLSISHSIIEQHGGRISAGNRSEGGAEFVIELPLVTELNEHPSSEPDEVQSLPPTAPKQILVIDDEPSIVRLLQTIAASEGHSVETATDGRAALAKLRSRVYDLIFCDVKMPLVNGQQLYQELKRFNGTLAKKIVFITGDVISTDTRAFLQQTGSRFLEKPFHQQDVVRLMRTLLAQQESS